MAVLSRTKIRLTIDDGKDIGHRERPINAYVFMFPTSTLMNTRSR